MAKYTVKSKEGELVFQSFGEVERAYLSGMVEPDDEVREEGSTRWRRAGNIPLLAQARRHGDQVWGGTQLLWIFMVIALGSVALYCLRRGDLGPNLGYLAVGACLTVLIAFALFRITSTAFKRSKPYR